MFPAASFAVADRVFTAFWVKFTDIEKLPFVATPVTPAAPPVMVTAAFCSAVPETVIESALIY